MCWITRKKTGNVVATDVPLGQEESILLNLPSGVYALETAEGIEYAESVVRGGKVRTTFRPVVSDGAGI